MSKRLAFMLAVALGAGGACAGSGTAHVGYAGSGAVVIRSPELVTVEEDVYVLADADEPVFYTDDYYWLYRGDRWYRSRSYDRGDWTYVNEPAPRLRRIQQPTAYARYRSRHQEARNVPRPAPAPRDPWRDQYDRRDAPHTLPPRDPQPLQPVQPQQSPTPYPRPPQSEPPREDVRDRTPPGQDVRDRTRDDVRTPPREDVRTPPGQGARPLPPRERDTYQRDDRGRPNPPPARADDRDNDHRDDRRDDRDDRRRDKDKKDKKHDH